MDKKINKNLAAIKNSIDKKSKNIDNSISNSKQEIIEQVNKPWHKDSKVILSLVITIVFTIFAICISYYVSNHFSEKTDKTLEEIKNVATNTNIEVTQNFKI